MRIDYQCVCDKCSTQITLKNEENDVSFNSSKHVYCDSCYKSLLAWWECWDSGNYEIISKEGR